MTPLALTIATRDAAARLWASPSLTDASPGPVARWAGRIPPSAVGAVLAVLAAALSAIGSWSVSLWADEAATISASTRTVGELWQLVHRIDAVHFGYYLGMHYWIEVFGRSPVSLRLPSALAVGLATAGVFALSRRIGLIPATAATVAAVFAVLPRVTWAGIEARSFACTAACAVWLTYLLVGAIARSNFGRWVGYALLAAAGIALNIYLVLLLVAHAIAVIVLADRWSTRWHWLTAAGIAGAAVSPIVAISAGQSAQVGDAGLTISALTRNVVVNQWFLGGTPTLVSGSGSGASSGAGVSGSWKYTAVLLAFVAWILVAIAIGVAARKFRSTVRGRELIAFLVPEVILPTLCVVGYTLAVRSLYNPRYFTFCAPALALLIGSGVRALPRRFAGGVAVLLLILAIPVYTSQRQPFAKSSSDWAAVAAFVAAHRDNVSEVYFTPLVAAPIRAVTESGSTTRSVAVCYPAAFAGLHDLTLLRTGAADASLTGVSRTLTSSGVDLGLVGGVLVLRQNDYPAVAASAEDRLFSAGGLFLAGSFRGPLTSVFEYVRR